MIEKLPKDILRKYYLQVYILLTLYILISIAIVLFAISFDAFGMIFMIPVLLIPYRLLVSFCGKRNIINILTKDLDGQKFNAVIQLNRYSPMPYKISALIAIGDYQNAVNIINALFQRKTKNQIYYLSALAQIYFELDDIDKLKEVCDYWQSNFSKVKFGDYQALFDFYRSYTDGDFARCILYCQNRIKVLNSRSKNNLALVNNYFSLALSYYKNSDYVNAKGEFEKVFHIAPKMNVSDVAQKYLNNLNEQRTLEFPEILSETNREIVFNENKVLKIVKCVGILLIVVGVIFVGVYHIGSYKQNKQLQEYENQLDTTISQIYDDFSILGYSNVSIDDQIIDVFCVIETKNGIDVVSYAEYSDGSKVALIRQSNMVINQVYTISSLAGNYLLDVGVYDADCIEKNIVKLNVTYQGESYVFCVTEHISPITQ